LPGDGTGLAVILRQEFKVEHIDDAIVVQIRGGGCGGVVTHADGYGIELVDDVIVINVTVGWVTLEPLVSVTSPWALRKPSATATRV